MNPVGTAANGTSCSAVGAELKDPPVLSLAPAILDSLEGPLLQYGFHSWLAKDGNETLDSPSYSMLAHAMVVSIATTSRPLAAHH